LGERARFTKEMAQGRKGNNIDKVNELVRRFSGKAKDWVTKKTWDANGNEIHYYEHPGMPRVGVKPAGALDPF
jgi:hypothetical protein